jgi:hypothetical protein
MGIVASKRAKKTKKWTAFATDYAKIIFPLINCEGGGINLGEGPFHLNSKMEIERAKRHIGNRPRWMQLHRITKTLVQNHLDGLPKVYFTSALEGPGVLMIDIDAHDGEQDAQEVANWCKELLPGSFWNRSDRGVHGYIVVDADKSKLQSLAKQWDRKREDIGFHAKVEIKGYRQGFNADCTWNCGTLAALPMVTQKTLNQLRDMPVLDCVGIQCLSKRIENSSITIQQLLNPDIRPEMSDKALKEREIAKRQTSQTDNVEKMPRAAQHPTSRAAKSIAELKENWSTDQRFQAIQLLARQLKGIPSTDQALHWLHANGLFSPPWENNTQNRLKDVQRIIAKISTTFDPKKAAKTVSHNYTPDAKHMVQSRIEYDQNGVVHWQDIVIYLLAVDEAILRNPNDDGSMPYKRLKELWPRINHKRKYDREWSDTKQKAIREYLISIRWLTQISDHIPPSNGQKGKAARFTIAKCHPLYELYKDTRIIKPLHLLPEWDAFTILDGFRELAA